MKNLFKKRWFRRFCQVGMVLVSLLAVVWMAVNWHGARLKRDAIARLEARGMPRDLSDILNDLPPESSNFGMIPLLKQAREECAERRQPGKPGPSMARLEEMFRQEFYHVRSTPGKSGGETADFSQLPEGGDYGKTAASFLTEYDRRNAATVRELAEGLSRPEARLALGGAPGTDWSVISMEFDMSLYRGVKGLGLRAQAALMTNDPEKAADSVLLMLRLGELLGSRGFMTSLLMEAAAMKEASRAVKMGMSRHVWREEDLQRLRAGFERVDLRGSAQRSVRLAARAWLDMWANWETHRKEFRNVELGWDMSVSSVSPLRSNWLSSWFPAGWFDMNGVESVEICLLLERMMRESATLRPWCEALRKIEGGGKIPARLAEFFSPGFAQVDMRYLLENVMPAEVLRCQAILACELESQRLKAGNYPAALDSLAGPVPLDPLDHQAFRYRKDGDSFILYSTGPDGIDGGGVAAKSKAPMQQKDWVW